MNYAEIFYVSVNNFVSCSPDSCWADILESNDGDAHESSGWYYWWGEPGCLPDSDPIGPFMTSEEASAAADDELACAGEEAAERAYEDFHGASTPQTMDERHEAARREKYGR